MSQLIYIIGIICAIWCVVDIFKKTNLEVWQKVILSLAVLLFSWVGIVVYYFLLRDKI